VHAQVIKTVVAYARELGFKVSGLDFSPIKGPEGNIEYLLYLTTDKDDSITEADIDKLVNASHGSLD
jgi:23S rRNA (cytidine1920-2'-O)/16S rRNA (cytidine1409-2'-O)-methyltransferase